MEWKNSVMVKRYLNYNGTSHILRTEMDTHKYSSRMCKVICEKVKLLLSMTGPEQKGKLLCVVKVLQLQRSVGSLS